MYSYRNHVLGKLVWLPSFMLYGRTQRTKEIKKKTRNLNLSGAQDKVLGICAA